MFLDLHLREAGDSLNVGEEGKRPECRSGGVFNEWAAGWHLFLEEEEGPLSSMTGSTSKEARNGGNPSDGHGKHTLLPVTTTGHQHQAGGAEQEG